MSPLELAHEYIEIIFSDGDAEKLRPLLADDLRFNGPFYEFNSADDYISSLKLSPPEGFRHEIIRSYEDGSSACLVYRFSKPGVQTPMAQMFKVENGKISEILLVFDTGAFE